jgi:hypothetical protein
MPKLKPILNRSEAATDVALRAAADKHGARVFAKVRLADVFELSAADLPGSHRSYALRSHFDFVVTCRHNNPLFGVEFDGPRHITDETVMRRDAMKGLICKRFRFPLLRVDAGFLHKIGPTTLLTWFIDLWFMCQWWCLAQERGEVPEDEGFPITTFFEQHPDGSADPLHEMYIGALQRILEAHRTGICRKWAPEDVWRFDEQVDRYAVTYSLLELTAGGFLLGSARCLVTGFGPVRSWEIALVLATADLGEKLRRYQQGRLTPRSPDQLAELRAETADWMRSGQLLDEDHFIIPLINELVWPD